MANNIGKNIEEVEIALGMRKGAEVNSQEWFKEKADEFEAFDKKAANLYTFFQNEFSPEKLNALEGETLLTKLFLCGSNESMFYLLEYEKDYREFFGSIKGGNAFKYPLHLSKNGKWATGTKNNPKFLTTEEASNKAADFRDLLNKCYFIVKDNLNTLNTLEGYKDLDKKLHNEGVDFVDSIWFSKYLHMMFPQYFSVFHNKKWQEYILNILKLDTDTSWIIRNGKITLFVKECGLSFVVFSQIIYKYGTELSTYDEPTDEDNEIIYDFNSSTFKGGKNLIIYGTPGCGKSYYVQNTLLKDYREENCIRTTFFSDYTNTDFVGQILPYIDGDKVTYKFNPGPFTLALEQAIRYPEEKVALVIEELNRGSAASIFGDIFQLLDRKDGVSRYPIKNVNIIKYLNDQFCGKYKFTNIRIPSNLNIFATMNTSDQNVFTLDTAFKRRWEFKKLLNVFLPDHAFKDKFVPGADVTWEQMVEKINEYMLEINDNLNNEDKQIGVYFVDETGMRKDIMDATSAEDIERFAYKFLEYLWDDVAKYDKTPWFKEDIKSLDQLVSEYTKSGIEVFNGDLKDKFKK